MNFRKKSNFQTISMKIPLMNAMPEPRVQVKGINYLISNEFLNSSYCESVKLDNSCNLLSKNFRLKRK